MTPTRNVAEFVKVNTTDVVRYLKHRYHIYRPDLIQAILSDLYLELLTRGTLYTWDPALGSYDRWVLTALGFMLNHYKAVPKPVHSYMDELPSSDGMEQSLADRILDLTEYIKGFAPPRHVPSLLIVLSRIIDRGCPENRLSPNDSIYKGLGWEVPQAWTSIVRDFLAEEQR